MLEIKDLHASIAGKEILKGLNLTVKPGEVHAIMGPNGAGKSTLSNVLSGHPAYTVKSGSVTFNGKDLLAMAPEVRAREGLFMSFQYPVEIPGHLNEIDGHNCKHCKNRGYIWKLNEDDMDTRVDCK